MKKNLFILFLLFTTVFIYSESMESPWTLSFGTGVSSLDGEPVVTIDGKITYSIASFLNIGYEAGAFHTLERTYKDDLDRKYQAESATSSLFIQPVWRISDKWNLGMKVGTGFQLVQFRYSGDLKDEMVWTEEILDKLFMETMTLGLTAEYSLCPRHSILLDVGYRSTPGTKSMFTEEDTIEGAFYGTLQYGIKF